MMPNNSIPENARPAGIAPQRWGDKNVTHKYHVGPPKVEGSASDKSHVKATVTFTHIPTGISVTGSLSQEASQLKHFCELSNAMEDKTWLEFERKVLAFYGQETSLPGE
jgi:hypothetical protein